MKLAVKRKVCESRKEQMKNGERVFRTLYEHLRNVWRKVNKVRNGPVEATSYGSFKSERRGEEVG